MTALRRVAAAASRTPRTLSPNPVPIYETILKKIEVIKAAGVPVEDISKSIQKIETSAMRHQMTWKVNERQVVQGLERDQVGPRRSYLLAMCLSCAAMVAAPKVAKTFT